MFYHSLIDAELEDDIVEFEADLAVVDSDCEVVDAAGLYYLHADHLGRPQFATDTSGAVVWDMGEGVTPFGDSVNLAGAFAQQLMFPGQYADVETGDDTTTLSHNWHRTYDPTLGRYLQSDPIGLAGGLNRYAYVGGNPVGAVDPMGLDYVKPGDRGHGNLEHGPNQPIGWYVVDLPMDPTSPSYTGNKRECRFGTPPLPTDDVDFFFHNRKPYKLLTGTVRIHGGNYSATPKRYKGIIPTVFDSRTLPFTYGAPNVPEYLGGKHTPMQYLNNLKENVCGCEDLPLDNLYPLPAKKLQSIR